MKPSILLDQLKPIEVIRLLRHYANEQIEISHSLENEDIDLEEANTLAIEADHKYLQKIQQLYET